MTARFFGLKSVGEGTVDGTRTKFVGTLTVLGGKGRFAGAKGDGTLTGTRLTPLSVGADLISDYTVNLMKQTPEPSNPNGQLTAS
jgi:hypothetical protein